MNIVKTLKQGHYSKTFFMILIMIDSLCIYLAYHLSFWSNFSYDTPLGGHYLSLGAIWILLWVVVALLIDNYRTENLKRVNEIIKSTTKSSVIHACFLFLYLFFSSYYYNSIFILETYLFVALLSITVKVVLLYSYRYLRNLEHNRIPYVIVGYTSPGRNIFRYLKKNQNFGYRFMGFFDDTYSGSLIKGRTEDIKKYCLNHNIREIYFALPNQSEPLNDLAKFADENFIHFGLVQEVGGMSFQKLESHTYDNIPVISYEVNKKPTLRYDFYREAFFRLLKQ